MALRYNGNGGFDAITIYIFGDGSSKSIDVNLKASPFVFNFQGNPPSEAVLMNRSGEPDVQLQFNPTTSILSITFGNPPPAVDFTLAGPRFGGRELKIAFAYSSVLAQEKK
jgi:hypothetical protein